MRATVTPLPRNPRTDENHLHVLMEVFQGRGDFTGISAPGVSHLILTVEQCILNLEALHEGHQVWSCGEFVAENDQRIASQPSAFLED